MNRLYSTFSYWGEISFIGVIMFDKKLLRVFKDNAVNESTSKRE